MEKGNVMEIIRKTITSDEEYLRQISTPIDFNNDNVMDYILALKEYCENNAVYALAPVQIGMPKRIIYIRNSNENMDKNIDKEYNEATIFINPEIVSEKGHSRFLEGCDSCTYMKGNIKIYYASVIDRPYSIEVEYYDVHGNKQKTILEGFIATIFKHENDHLNGKLHLDKASEIYEMTLEEMKQYRELHPYEVISTDKPFELVRK